MASTDESLEPWLDSAADNSVQTLVRCIVPGKQVKHVELGGKRDGRVEDRTAFDDGECRDMGWVVGEMLGEAI